MKTYLVGGAVRDKLLGYPYHERDWVVVGATADDLLAKGYQAVGKDFPVFLHPETKEEYALARTERKTGPGYTGFDCYAAPSVTLEQDLQRRDLTINAIAEDSEGVIIDPYNGLQDIKNKKLRHVSAAFTEDPLRVLRVARFSARYSHLGFSVADETLSLMQTISAGDELLALPAERIWKELERSLTEKDPQMFFQILHQTQALDKLMPELNKLANQHYGTLEKAARLKQPSIICFALLFIDILPTDTEQLCQRIRSPKEFRELALLISRHAYRYRDKSTTPEHLLDLLNQLDPFRRKQRFDNFLRCCELLFDDQRTSQRITTALDLCNSIKPAELAQQGLSGKAIAQALQQMRLTAIKEHQQTLRTNNE